MDGGPGRFEQTLLAPAEQPLLGRPTLALLRRLRSVSILRELQDATLRPHELERRLPGLSHAALMRRLAELAHAGAIGRERTRDTPPHAYYAIAPHGRAMLQIAGEARAWERLRRAAGGPAGVRALRVVGDEATLAIIGELSAGALGPRELGRRLRSQRPISHGSLMRRLSALSEQELLRPAGDPPRGRYGLTVHARLLARLLLLSMRAERARLDSEPALPAVDLMAMMRVLAPALAAPEDLCGTFALHVASGGDGGSALHLQARGGTLAALDRPPAEGVSGFMVAPVDTWLRSLGGRPAPGLVAAGDVRALEALLSVLGAPIGLPDTLGVSHS